MRYRFEGVRRQVTREVACPNCGNRRKKIFTGEATYNPFNKGDPPAQALADAERQADKGAAEGIICQWCAEAPYREALVAFADGRPLPDRSYGNPTDILIDRGNVKEVIDQSRCPHCEQPQWKVVGYELTDKGKRVVEKLRPQIEARRLAA